MYIYKITNLITNKIYVGQTTRSILLRLHEHFTVAKRHKIHCILGNSIRKYGKENFTIEELEKCNSLEHLNEREIFWIKQLNSKTPNGYNMTDGGDGTTGRKHTEISKEKIRLSRIGRTFNHTEETKQKIRIKHLGKTVNENTKQKLRLFNLGKKHSYKTRQLLKIKIKDALSHPDVKLRNKNKCIGLKNSNATEYIIQNNNFEILKIRGYKNVLKTYNKKYNTNILDAAYFIRQLKNNKNIHFKLLDIIKINHKEK